METTGKSPTVALLVSFCMLTVALPGTLAEGPEETYWSILVDSVDASRMMDTVETLQGFGSREFHLESSREAARFIYDSFEALGLDVEYQHFQVEDTLVSNVVATLNPSPDEGNLYLVGAHYDSENRLVHNLSTAENITAPGADDDASGIAAMMEVARILADSVFDANIKFVAFGAEEYGYDNSGGSKGSEYFVSREIESGVRYRSTAILDMVGYRTGEENRAVMVVDDSDYPLAGCMSDSVERFSIDLSLVKRYDPSITYSDHGPFWESGIPCMLVVEELDQYTGGPVNPYYHTSEDTADHVSPEQLEAVTKALLGGLLLLEGDDGRASQALVFGIVIMSAAAVSVAALVFIRRRRGRFDDD